MITIRGLCHFFPDGTPGLDNIELDITKGEKTLLVGKNGSGKTLLMRHIAGLIEPQKGEILIDGLSPYSDTNARKKVGIVFQDADLQLVRHSVYDEIAFGPENMALPKSEIRDRVERTVSLLGLGHIIQRHPRSLSGGEKRRVSIASVLAMEPEYLFLDEPFANLDWPGILSVLDSIESVHKTGCTIVLISHDVLWIRKFVDTVVLMDKAKVIAKSSFEQIEDLLREHGVLPPKDMIGL
ncbi:ABC transporter ATP-binding protein [Spirochaetia bacterium 38H-sp]|uniref:ABC transporter ATP-binding protein n=1 Tax=Rarispira pelagica TaxID=3141764 RepID=A0ABU9UBJ5_9SPIR